uniref:Myosin VIIBb n=1 Tax=Sphaeramia orbicularis TaxID=375764 RepID=A0A672ZFW3_9TELE
CVILSFTHWVWVESDSGVPIGARVKVTASGHRLLVDDEGKVNESSTEFETALKIMHPTSVEGVEDMIKLGDMTEAGLLRNLLLRHKQGNIYTYTGSVLVAVNPYQDFPLYSSDQVSLYRGRKLGELPPHIFAIAESCYFNMKRHLKNQCCIISGESGAGKTESTKLILQYLAAVSGQLSEQHIEQQILESNPILEAFGNAKTVRNDNSSRFGKYLEIFFTKNGVIEGARVEQYLLEKSRVCHQALEERNYHIFYCLLAGITPEERKTLKLGNAKEYKFLTKGDCITCDGRDDAEDYKRICSAMKILTFSEHQCQDILKLLAAILHLGNVCFEGEWTLDDVSKSEHFSITASLLEVQKSSLAKSLTHRSFMTNTERVTKPLSSEQASDCRDAFVKAIYNKLFIWIVKKINSVIYKKLANQPKTSFLSIGLLDIFGFENFDTNSFEQLCINFANEKLQQFFVGHIFKLEQKEYKKEDITWNNISFSDNQNILDLLAVKPCNLLALIDEESHFPKGSDNTMLQKMNHQHSGSKVYISSKSEHDTDFGICHFAGVVYYDSKGFLEKNRDAVSFDLIRLIDTSTNKLFHQIFESDLSNNAMKITNNKKVIMTPKNSVRPDNRKQMPTLSGQFRQSLDSLMKALSACQPYFIRCFKPNNEKQSERFDRELCMRQLRYSGMMDTIRIRKLGYPIRHTFEDFLKRYRVLLKTTICNPKTETAAACCEAICETVIKGEDEWKIGRSKIFLKDAHDAALERLREQELSRVAVVIQRVMLGIKDRCSFKGKIRNYIIFFSQISYWMRKDFKQKKKAVILMQATARGFLARRLVQKMREDVSAEYVFSVHCPSPYTLHLVLVFFFIKVQDSELEEKEISGATLDPEAAMNAPPSISSTPVQSDEDDDSEDDFDDTNEEFSFIKFSRLNFQGDATPTHITQRVQQPLLSHDDEADAQACLTVFWIILRFMGDMPELKSIDSVSQASSTISRNLPHRQGRRLSHLVGLDQKILRKNKKKLGAGGRRATAILEEPEDTEDESEYLVGEATLRRKLSSLEKLHVIIGYALSRRDIRDEIYCQICKQLVNNRNKQSRLNGWVLLSICLGIFPPTDLFVKYLENFVRKGPDGYGAYCSERLRRIIANGERKELPCWIELEAARSKHPIDVSVTLMDDHTVKLPMDSASTSVEICQTVANKINLKDTYGFSLYISLYEKMWSLGSCGKHVLDAVSQCEQEVRRQGKDEKQTPWKLFIRKELFTPWHDSTLDPISTDLIYRQVIKGIKSGEYTSEKEDEYVEMAAKHYYIQYGSGASTDNVQKVVEECITTTLIENKSKARWVQLISAELTQGPYTSGKQKTETVKGELVEIARQKWPLHFSKFYEVTMTSGPPLNKSKFVVAVNWSGIFFTDERDRRLIELPYLEVKDVEVLSYFNTKSVRLVTVQGDFVLKSVDAVDMAALIAENLEGLRDRTEFALVQSDTNKSDDDLFLACKRGDLLLLKRDEDYRPDQNWIKAINQRTNTTGAVYKDTLQFLPTLSRPSEDMLEMLSPRQKKISVPSAPQRDDAVAPVSLRDFARENFRQPGKDVGRHGANKGFNKEKLWSYSREPIKQPLMKSLVRNSELSALACNAFTDILETSYMGDYPIKHARSPIELTDQIFGPATQHEALQDEIYCQIMRQMTTNNSRLSRERGWQLMWLVTGLFPPSPDLITHTRRFLESRPRESLAAGCLQRLQAMLRSEPRKLPPHLVEVDAIQQNSTQIFHKVHFPDERDEIFAVTSTTTIKELCYTVASQLKFKSVEGYGLYLKTASKGVTLQSLNEEKYFFDSLRETSDAPKKAKKVKEANAAYMVIFKRKLWFNVSPGKDLIADLTCHFPQELYKYLRGYHNCTKEDMFTLGGMLFRSEVDSDRSQFVMIPKMLKTLVPADQLELLSKEEWKKHIISSYNKQSGTSVQEAKIAFLRLISSWPTFGCDFFEVKQTCESSYPSILWVAINKHGVSLIDPKTKEILIVHPFSRITECHSRGDIFQMTIGTMVRGVTFVCETSYTMEDLLRSYVNMYENQRKGFQSKINMFS